MCILAVRAIIVQIAFYLHIQTHVFGRPVMFTRPLAFATAFIGFFSVVIALFKNIPDIEGDKIFGIGSFFFSLLQMAYAVAIQAGATSPFIWSKVILLICLSYKDLVLVIYMLWAMFFWQLWTRAKSVDLSSKTEITSCYMFIWKLFYSEYLLLPFLK
ncbi:hypothetical protein Bca4012_061338 [Brassica carinata]|uniref:Uncharacterized protein n=1 Tax=Brassica carinata TaxID=52824 RepID=A0A8X7SAX6_BRACI|nr:hypothetical protein Bca52824_031632 [Brassica carinata]